MGLTGNEIEDSLLQVVRLILYVLKLSFCRNLPGFCSPSHIAEDICLKNLVLLQSRFSWILWLFLSAPRSKECRAVYPRSLWIRCGRPGNGM